MALRSVAEFHRRYEEAASKKQVLREDEHRLDQYDIGHWHSATRHLFKERFIVHKEVPLEMWEKKHWPSRKFRQAWEITPKGLLALQLVEIEVVEQSQTLKLDKAQLRVLKAA